VTEPAPDREALETAQALTEALTGTREQVAALTAAVRRSRRHIVALAVSLLLDVALTVVVAIFAVQAHSASDRATRADVSVTQLHASQVAGCQAGNQQRAEQIGLWEHIYSLAKSGKKLTAAQRRADNALIAYIRKTFAAKNCAVLYRLP
jgi:hypothetical protein